MLELYCDSSYNENETSYIGCMVLKAGKTIHQSTTKVPGFPENNLECELAALRFALSLAKLFFTGEQEIIIYNDSTEAVKAYQSRALALGARFEAELEAGPEAEFEPDFGKNEEEKGKKSREKNSQAGIQLSFEYTPREKPRQAVADSLSKKYPVDYLDLPSLNVESFSRREDLLSDIARNGRSVFYLQNEKEKSTKSRTCYRLIIRSAKSVLSDDRLYLIKKGGQGTQIKAAEQLRQELLDPAICSELKAKGVRFEQAYFLLTDETWGLRLTDNKAYSILPSKIPHKIICDEVNRDPENLFRRVEPYR
ncbi:MAG: hypothetical protein PHD26_02095 [Methanosarcinaceae archaeon]|nr:hypothetical protein [Methanosarcinaceae archaeon]